VHLKKVEEKQLPELDDEFCREYGVLEGGIEQLRKEVRENMERELEQNVRARLKAQLMEGLLAATRSTCRKAWWTRRCARCRSTPRAAWAPATPRRCRRPSRSSRARAGASRSPADRRADQDPRPQDRPRARRIAFGRPRCELPRPGPDHQGLRQNADALRQIENVVIEDQVVDLLLEKARVNDQPATFKDVMNFGRERPEMG